MNTITKREEGYLLEAYNSVTGLIVEDEADDMQAINKYADVKEFNIYLKPAEGPIEQLYKSLIDPEGVTITRGVTTIIGTDEDQDVKVQIVIDQEGDTSVTPTKDGRTIDGPWFEKDIIYFETNDPEELNIMIVQEV